MTNGLIAGGSLLGRPTNRPRVMTALLIGLGLTLWHDNASGGIDKVLQTISWKQPRTKKGIKATLEANGHLRVTNTSGGRRRVKVWSTTKPGINFRRYHIQGLVRYEDMSHGGHLEMWSVMHDGRSHTTQAMSLTGPLGKFQGSKGWQVFVLPFDTLGLSKPKKLIVNMMFNGNGIVELGTSRLVVVEPGSDLLTPPGHWWGDGTTGDAGLIGGVAGAVAGILALLLGWLGLRFRVVRAALVLLAAAGVASLGTAVVALIDAQPFVVYFPFLLPGAVGAAMSGAALLILRKRRVSK